MIDFLKSLFRKSAPGAIGGNQWTGTSFIDSFKRERDPSPNELLAELKNTAFTCATINAAACASFPPKLYVSTFSGNTLNPKCLTKKVDKKIEDRIRSLSFLPSKITKAVRIEEVIEHPLLTLLTQINPVHNAFDLWELTTLYQEVHGSAYWFIDFNALGTPSQIWILPSQNVTPKRNPNSRNLVDYYEYRTGTTSKSFDADEIIHFRYPDPRNPYTSGLSPLRACFEQVAINSDFAAFKRAKLENRAIPDAVISPDENIGEEERDRLEAQWNSKFRRGGAGKVVVGETGLKVQLLNQSLGDIAALADIKATKEDIANAFHVPIAFLVSQTNLANLQASQSQHMTFAISPRLQRRDQKINERLMPMYDPSGRLFVSSEDPTPIDQNMVIAQRQLDIKYGITSINEVRSERGLAAVDWGNTPWLPLIWAPTDLPDRPLYAPRESKPRVGRSKKPKQEG